ncbi:MAG: hypothetical protein ACXIVG_12275 [Pararhodobacter sp.]
MDEPRSVTLNTTLFVWSALLGAFVGVKSYTQAPLWIWSVGALWLTLALVAALAQTSTGGQKYLAGTLRTSHYTPVYRFVARRLNDWVWQRVGRLLERPDKTMALPSETMPVWPLFRAALTWRLIDRALLIAVAYPLLALLLPWLLGGDAVLGSGVVVFEAADFWPERATLLVLFTILGAGLLGQKLASGSPSRFVRKTGDWLPLMAVTVAFVVAAIDEGKFVFAGVGAGAMVIALAIARTGLIGMFFSLAGAFAVVAASTLSLAYAGSLAVAIVFSGAFALAFSGAALVAAAFAFATVVAFSLEEPQTIMFAFGGVSETLCI